MKSVYLKIAEAIAGEIVNGHFPLGERLYSRRELCTRYEISGQTAVRVQDALAKMGLVRKVRGCGILSNYLGNTQSTLSPSSPDNRLKRIVFFAYANKFIEEFQVGARQRAGELNLDFRIEYVNFNGQSKNVFSAYPINADEAYIAVSCDAIHFATGALLFSPSVKSVLIDFITPGSSCVIADNFDGIGQLVNHAVSRGCRRFIFSTAYHGGSLNISERKLAFSLEMKYRGLDGTVSESGNFGDIIDILKSRTDVTTAVIFPQDDPALLFKKVLRKTKLKSMPLVTGFDDFTFQKKGLEHLTTLRVNRAGMGAAAVNILYESDNDFHQKIVRIPGTLIVRK